mgnify:CR=1 FL=1
MKKVRAAAVIARETGGAVTPNDFIEVPPTQEARAVPKSVTLAIEAIKRGLIESDKTYSLQMPTSAGKTTLIRTMMGYVRPASGEVQVDGRTVGIHEHPPADMAMPAITLDRVFDEPDDLLAEPVSRVTLTFTLWSTARGPRWRRSAGGRPRFGPAARLACPFPFPGN